MPCVIKFDHKDGVKLLSHEHVLWCGGKRLPFDFCFEGIDHAVLSAVPVCDNCLLAIIEANKSRLKG